MIFIYSIKFGTSQTVKTKHLTKMDTAKADAAVNKFKKRVAKERQLNKEENNEFEFAPLDDTHWYFRFTIQDGPYAGQKHIIQIKLVYGQNPNTYVYPMYAPLVTFETPIWHPNISEKGTICLDVLKDNWSPSIYTSSIISILKMLLLNPEPSSPQNQVAAKMMTDSPEQYLKKIKDFYDYDKAQDIRKLFR